MVTKEQVRDAMADVDALDLSDGAHWAMVAERLGLDVDDVWAVIVSDPAFFDCAVGGNDEQEG